MFKKKCPLSLPILLLILSCSTASNTVSSPVTGGDLFKVPADREEGFNYDYYLYIPHSVSPAGRIRLLVEPNNSGTTSDSHRFHDRRAKELITYGYGRKLADALRIPLLVPTFDRPAGEWTMYTHSLDSDSYRKDTGDLARVDLQLVRMIDSARGLLLAREITLEKKVLLQGFSASGSFVNRFAALHPELVRAYAAGGVNGMPIIPLEERNGKRLNFHVGVGDIDFDAAAFGEVAQFLYMGEGDTNDTLPYDDAYNEDERTLTREILGESMGERWERSRDIYLSLPLDVRFATYPGVGHSITPAIYGDILSFFRENYE